MTLPPVIKIAAFDITLIEWHPHAANASHRFAEFSCQEQCIRIDTSVSKYKVADSLLHEINHAIYWAYGLEDSDKEERIVGTFATAWVQIMRDNPILPLLQEILFGPTPP